MTPAPLLPLFIQRLLKRDSLQAMRASSLSCLISGRSTPWRASVFSFPRLKVSSSDRLVLAVLYVLIFKVIKRNCLEVCQQARPCPLFVHVSSTSLTWRKTIPATCTSQTVGALSPAPPTSAVPRLPGLHGLNSHLNIRIRSGLRSPKQSAHLRTSNGHHMLM